MGTWLEERRKQKEEAAANNSTSTSTSTPSNSGGSSWLQNRRLERSKTVAEEIQNRLNSWNENLQGLYSDYNSRYGGDTGTLRAYRSDYSDWLDTVNKRSSALDEDYNYISSALRKYGDYLDPEWASEVSNYLKDTNKGIRSIKSTARQDYDIFSQFEDEDTYNTWAQQKVWENKYAGKDYSEMVKDLGTLDPYSAEAQWLSEYSRSDDVMTIDILDKELSDKKAQLDWYNQNNKFTEAYDQQGNYYQTAKYAKEINALNNEIEQLKAQKWRITNRDKYSSLAENEDFNTVSSAVDKSINNYDYNYINDIDGFRNKENARAMISGGNDATRTFGYMTDDEVNTYNYLYHSEGKRAANEYLDYLSYDLNARATAENKRLMSEFADNLPVTASAISVPVNLMSIVGYADVLGQNIARDISGEYRPIDYNTAAMSPSNVSTTIRGTVAQNIADATGVIQLDEGKNPVLSKILNGKSLGDVYQLGMSMADSAAIIPLGPAGTVLLGGSAASQGTLEALERGANDSQALTMGLMNGAFEMLFERVSLENLLSGNSKNVVTAFFKQGFIEGSEEFNTTLANNIADILVMAEKSDYKKNIAAYMASGLSEEDATKQALLDMCIEMGWDFIGGVASGGVMGSAAAPIQNKMQQNADAKAMYGSSLEELVAEALELNPDSRLAKRTQDKLTDGKEISGGTINRLVNQNNKAIVEQDIGAISTAAEIRLSELGETGDITAIASALAKEVSGQKLSRKETEIISTSKYGQRVRNELNPENIRSGEFSSAWAEKIDTSKLNVEEYSRLLNEAETATEAQTSKSGQVIGEDDKTAPVGENGEILKGAQQNSEATPTAAQNTPVNVLSNEYYNAAQVEDVEPSETRIEDVAEKYGAQSTAFVRNYNQGQDVEIYDMGFEYAYNQGKSGVPLSTVLENAHNSSVLSQLTDTQLDIAYNIGADVAKTEASEQHNKIISGANGKTGRRKGVVRGQDVSISDLRKTFNDKQNVAYKLLSSYAEATGIDIVLYKADDMNDKGEYTDKQGKFKAGEDTIYININAGLFDKNDVDNLSKYTMLRTFSHEFVHFIEKYNPVEYNEFRRFVFEKLTERGENVNDLIEEQMALSEGLTYEMASREVVAEAMTDILPDSSIMQDIAENHQNIFKELLAKLKEFIETLKQHFKGYVANSAREANALKEEVDGTIKYLDDIVAAYDKLAKNALNNYQATVATDEVIEEAKVEETVKAEPKSDTSKYGFTVTDNLEFGSLEISFENKPSEAVRNVLKENKFRWHGKKGVWYGKADRENIIDALNSAYEAEKAAQEAESSETERAEIRYEMKPNMSSAMPTQISESTATETSEFDADGNPIYETINNRKPIEPTNYKLLKETRELEQKRSRYNEVMDILNPKEEQSLDNIAEEDVQNQARRPYPELSKEAVAYTENIDAWVREGRPEGEKFILGSTGAVLQGLGAIENDIYILGDKINTILREHPEMTLDAIKRIPEILEDPVLILKSKTVGKSLVMYGSLKAQNGQPVLVALNLRPVENNIVIEDMQKVSSAYTKTETETKTAEENARNLVTSSEILYADKNRTVSLLRSIGFYMPIELQISGSVGSIHYNQRSVNIKGEPFEKVFKTDDQNQERRKTYSDREVLAVAAEHVSELENLTEGQRDALKILKKRLDRLEELEVRRTELGQQYREQQFGAKVDRAKAAETLKMLNEHKAMIEQAENDVLKAENTEVLKRTLKVARKFIENQEKEAGQEILRRYRERRDNAAAVKKYRTRIKTDVDTLTKWILHPSNKDVLKHVPDALKTSVIPFLSSIDFTSKRMLAGGEATQADLVFIDRLKSLRNALNENFNASGAYSGYNDLPPEFMENLQRFIDTAQTIVDNNKGTYVINEMTAEELKSLSKLVRTLKKFITEMNRFHANAMFEHVYEAGDSSIEFMNKLDTAKHTGLISDFTLWQQMRPAYAFERFGEGGMAIYDGLRKGQATLAFNTKKITDFANKAYTEAEVKAWEKETKTFRLGGDTVVMPISHMMSFYELSKRPQALGHILGAGVRVATVEVKDGKKKKKVYDTGHKITESDIDVIVNALTPRQKAVADSMQQFMAKQGGAWGNYVSLRRFGEEMFGEEHYFPINSDGQRLQAEAEKHPTATSLYALLNMSFTKELQENANNRIILYSIFDVFANHMSSMAQYNAFALPILDALKWFNYQTVEIDSEGNKSITGSVREEMARAFGVPVSEGGKEGMSYAERFVMHILQAFNGTEAQGSPKDSLGVGMLHRYNISQVAYNFRVVVQQPLAIARAGLLVDYKSIIKGLKLSPSAIKTNIEEMQKYSGIAAWKALGFYDINISRGVTQLIKHDESFMDKVTDIGMWGAEKADTLTWAAIWSACKEEVIRKQHLKPSSAGFYEAVSALFEDVIYKTQVVDSVLTKNEWIRDKGYLARTLGAFMSEPTTTASMLIDTFDKYVMDIKRGLTSREAWRNNSKKIGRVATVYAVSQILLAAVQSIIDAFRDDDDYENYWEKYLEALKGNLIDELNPFNKLPIIGDFVELIKSIAELLGADTYGNTSNSIAAQIIDYTIKGSEIILDKINGEDTNYTWYGGIYKLLQATSGATGLPLGTATREIITAWNSTAGYLAPSLKVKTYDPTEKSNIKYAFEDGYLTQEEAIANLVETGAVDDRNEAYWTVQGWASDNPNFSKYSSLYDAALTGGNYSKAVNELKAHGITDEEIQRAIRSRITKWFTDGEISESEAKRMYTKYGNMTDTEARERIEEIKNK